MPIPAVPPPKMTTRWSRHRVPVTLTALNSPAMTMAPVPWMSSLNIRYLSRLASRIRRALLAPKSSKCSSAFGNRSEATCRYLAMKAS